MRLLLNQQIFFFHFDFISKHGANAVITSPHMALASTCQYLLKKTDIFSFLHTIKKNQLHEGEEICSTKNFKRHATFELEMK